MSDLFNNTFSADGISVYYGSTCAVDNVSFDLCLDSLMLLLAITAVVKPLLLRPSWDL